MYSEDILKFINSFYMKRTGKRVKGLNVTDLYFQEEALIHVDKRSHHLISSKFFLYATVQASVPITDKIFNSFLPVSY